MNCGWLEYIFQFADAIDLIETELELQISLQKIRENVRILWGGEKKRQDASE